MASDLEQFAELELSKEDREQIFDPPTDRQHMEGAGTSRYVNIFFYIKFLIISNCFAVNFSTFVIAQHISSHKNCLNF